MTICVALKSEDGVWIASDSRVTSGSGMIYPGGGSKWFAYNGVLLALAGNDRIRHILPYAVSGSFPSSPESVAKTLRTAVKTDGWNEDADRGEPVDYCYDAIIVGEQRVIYAHGSGAFLDFKDELCAIGTGRPFAYGVAHALHGMAPEIIVRTAVEAACRYDSSCGGEIFVELVK